MHTIRGLVLSIVLGLSLARPIVVRAEASRSTDGPHCAAALADPAAPILEVWIEQLRAAYQTAESDLNPPPSFKSHSWWSRAKNDLFLLQLKSSLAPGLSIARLSWFPRGSAFESLTKFVGTADADAFRAAIDRGLLDVGRFQIEYRRDIERYAALYGAEFFGPAVFDKGTVNTMMGKLFAMLSGRGAPRSRDAVNAIALLHPITDEALDRGTMSPSSLRKLSRFLEDGAWPDVETPFEGVVFALLGYIYRDFPPAEHPVLHRLLRRLHAAQLRSVSQKREMSERDVLDLSFEKGGISLVIAAYLALDGLTPAQHEFFFKAGAIFQILDDLSDIATDLDEGGRTVWTEALADRRPLGAVARRFFNLQAVFEREIPGLTASFDDHRLFSRIYLKAFRIMSMRAFVAHRAHFTRPEIRAIRRHFPISFATIRKGFEHAGRSETIPEELREIARALDSY